MWDSIQTAASLFSNREENPNVVKALIFVSDGRDTSSEKTRADAGVTATVEEVQLYALGVGDVFESTTLAEIVGSTGGEYYPVKELDALQGQLQVVVSDLRGQYRVSYITLRRTGIYQTQVQVGIPGADGTFETPPRDVASFYAPDIEGRIGIDPPAVDSEQRTAQLFIRALHVPRNVDRIRFRLDTQKAAVLTIVPAFDGGLLEGWQFSGPDQQGYLEASNIGVPLEFGNSGLLFHLSLSDVTEKVLEIPITFDNTIYTGGKSFRHPATICIGECVPPQGRIAFRTDRGGDPEIYVMKFDGSEQVRLTDDNDDEFLPAWSPDGLRIVFDSDRIVRRHIFVMNDDGTEIEPLSPNPPMDRDGRREGSGRG